MNEYVLLAVPLYSKEVVSCCLVFTCFHIGYSVCQPRNIIESSDLI